MEVVIAHSPAAGAALVADAIGELVRRRADAVLGLATGSSPEPVYDELARRHEAGTVDLSAVSTFSLDEYLGLEPGHPAAYRQVIERQVVRRLGIDPAPPGFAGKDYVLGKFSPEQRPLVDAAVRRAAEAIVTWIESGIDKAMNRFNADVEEKPEK